MTESAPRTRALPITFMRRAAGIVSRPYVITFAATAIVMLAYLISFRVARSAFGIEGFSEYALARRTLSLITPVAVLGADYATARYVAYVSAEGGGRSRTYFSSALVVMLVGVVVMSACLLSLSPYLSRLFF